MRVQKKKSVIRSKRKGYEGIDREGETNGRLGVGRIGVRCVALSVWAEARGPICQDSVVQGGESNTKRPNDLSVSTLEGLFRVLLYLGSI